MNNKEEQIHFAQRLAFLLGAGVALRDSLLILESHAPKKSKVVMTRLVENVSRGLSLSASLAQTKGWGTFALQIIKVGEMGGNLAINLSYLSEELKKRHILKRKIQGALVYPAFVSIAALCIAVLMVVSIFPKILPIFKSINVTLPLSTKVLIIATDLVSHYWVVGLTLLIVLPVLLLFLVKKYPRFKLIYYGSLLYLPIISQLVKSATVANICRTLSLLLKSGISLDRSLGVVSMTVTHPFYKREIIEAEKCLSRGERISTHFLRRKSLFEPLVSQMIAIGETTGNLADVLMYLSELYEREIDELTKNLSNSIEPILMIVMGLGVGFIAVAVITPIYAITQNLHH